MVEITGTKAWKEAHPRAAIGLFELSGVENHQANQVLNLQKREIETYLRHKYDGYARQDFLGLPVIAAYNRYYKRFDKTYHVQLQVESIVLKAKSLPEVSPLVDANFMAELQTLVLTAGHDVSRLEEPVVIDISKPGDVITQLNGTIRELRPGDMVMRDREAISCTILYGQDNRSPITTATRCVLYVAYAPPGVPHQSVEAQFSQIEEYVRLFSPQTRVEQRQLIFA